MREHLASPLPRFHLDQTGSTARSAFQRRDGPPTRYLRRLFYGAPDEAEPTRWRAASSWPNPPNRPSDAAPVQLRTKGPNRSPRPNWRVGSLLGLTAARAGRSGGAAYAVRLALRLDARPPRATIRPSRATGDVVTGTHKPPRRDLLVRAHLPIRCGHRGSCSWRLGRTVGGRFRPLRRRRARERTGWAIFSPGLLPHPRNAARC